MNAVDLKMKEESALRANPMNEGWGEFLCICVYLTFYSKIDHIDKLGSTDNKEIKNNSDI